MFKKEVEQRIKDMEFFGFSHVNNFTKDDYKALLINCQEEYYKMLAEKNRNRIKEKETATVICEAGNYQVKVIKIA